MRQDRLRALAKLCAAKKDADLAQLSGITARLTAAKNAREALECALAKEIGFAAGSADVPLMRVLDAHVLLAEQSRSAIEHSITRLSAEREGVLDLCRSSFGRASVLADLSKRLTRQAKSAI